MIKIVKKIVKIFEKDLKIRKLKFMIDLNPKLRILYHIAYTIP